MSDAQPRSYCLPLDFLQSGRSYRATVFSDTPGRQQATRSQIAVSADSVVPVVTEPNGGHLMVIEPVRLSNF
jgi:hypothetical protein